MLSPTITSAHNAPFPYILTMFLPHMDWMWSLNISEQRWFPMLEQICVVALSEQQGPSRGAVWLSLFVNGRNWYSSLQAGFWNVYCPLNDSLIFNIMVGWSLILWLKMSIFTADWACLNGKQFTCIENHINRSTYLLTLKEEGTLYSKAFQFWNWKWAQMTEFILQFPPQRQIDCSL